MDLDERLGQIDWRSIWEIENKDLDELLYGYYPDLTEKEKVICKMIFCFYYENPPVLYDLIVPTTVEWHEDFFANEKLLEDEIKHVIEKGIIKLGTVFQPADGCGSNDCERRIVRAMKVLNMSNMDVQNQSWLIQCKVHELIAAYFPRIKNDTTYEYPNQTEYYIKQDLEEYYNQIEYSRYHCRKQNLVFEQERNCCLLPWGCIHHKDNNNQNNVWYNLEGMMNYYHTCYSMYDWARRTKSQEDYEKRVLELLEKHKTDPNIKGDRDDRTGYYAVRDMGLDISRILRGLVEKDFFPYYMTEEGKTWWLVAVLESEIEQIWLWSWQAVLYYGFSIDIGEIRYFIKPRF